MTTPQSPDEYGYTGYNVCIPMSPQIRDPILELRKQIEAPVLTMPVHITVKGNFTHPRNLDQIVESVSAAAGDTATFPIELGDLLVWGRVDARILAVSISTTPPLEELHIRLFHAIDPISTNIYGGTGEETVEGFRFHVTLYQGVTEVSHEKGLALARKISLPRTAQATRLYLMGRAPVSGNGYAWRIIGEFPLGG